MKLIIDKVAHVTVATHRRHGTPPGIYASGRIDGTNKRMTVYLERDGVLTTDWLCSQGPLTKALCEEWAFQSSLRVRVTSFMRCLCSRVVT